MRLSLALCGLLLAGCAGPHSTGALWAQQNLEREAALSRSTEAQRAAQAQAFELTLADEALSAERLRVEEGLQDCPGERRPFALSAGDKVRDTIRLHPDVLILDLDLHDKVAAMLRPAHVEGPIDRQRMVPGLRPLATTRAASVSEIDTTATLVAE